MSPMQGKSPPVQVKEPYGNLDMFTDVGFHPATRSVKIHLPIILERIWQYIEKERSLKGFQMVKCFIL